MPSFKIFCRFNIKLQIQPFKLLTPSSTRENWLKTITEPVAIISICLKDLKNTGTPSILTYNSLFSWLHGNVIHFNIDYNLDNSSSHENFEIHLEEMLTTFTRGKFKAYICYIQ
jgi:hypothetical protein